MDQWRNDEGFAEFLYPSDSYVNALVDFSSSCFGVVGEESLSVYAYGTHFLPHRKEAINLSDFTLPIEQMFVHDCVNCLDVIAAPQENCAKVVAMFIPCNHLVHGCPRGNY